METEIERLKRELSEAIRCEAQLSSNIQSLKGRVTSELGFDSTKPQLECWHLAAQVKAERDLLKNQNAELKAELTLLKSQHGKA